MKKLSHRDLLQSVIQFGLSVRHGRRHSIQVCRLCCMLFDELQSIHHMGNTERIWLQIAALLHDVGKVISSKEHNKRSRDIIIKSANLPFNKRERITIGLIARYHRGAHPNRSHRYYGKLDSESRYYVRKLAAILRFADGLDGNHRNSVSDLSCQITEENVIVCPESEGSFDPQKAIGKADLLEDVLNRKVVIIEQSESVLPSNGIESPDDLGYTDAPY
ncbi:MAG: HD domain-containing protein [Sedimentisphaerales bacterium]|jgi:exopolyphosphatase/guanosine-5'-triphosphate,3'-diphosphate pyrophosphatase